MDFRILILLLLSLHFRRFIRQNSVAERKKFKRGFDIRYVSFHASASKQTLLMRLWSSLYIFFCYPCFPISLSLLCCAALRSSSVVEPSRPSSSSVWSAAARKLGRGGIWAQHECQIKLRLMRRVRKLLVYVVINSHMLRRRVSLLRIVSFMNNARSAFVESGR